MESRCKSGIESDQAIQRNGMNIQETVQAVIDLDPSSIKERDFGPFGYPRRGGSREYLINTIRYADRFWRPELGKYVVRIAETIHPLSAQRFIEHIQVRLEEDPEFDVDEYGVSALSVYETFGRTFGDYYTREYPNVVGEEISGEDFVAFLNKCHKEGGKMFASWMLRASGNIRYAGGELEEFSAEALEVRKRGGLKLIKPLAQHAGEITISRKQEVFVQDFKNITLEAVDTLGEEATYWLLRVLPKLTAKHKINPFDFFIDMKKMAEIHGQRAVKQYLAGMSKNLHTLRQTEGDEAQERLDAARESFMFLRDNVNKTASRFFAFRGMDMTNSEMVLGNKNAIIMFHRRVKPKVFHAATWHVSIIDTVALQPLLQQIAIYAQSHTPEDVIQELAYASTAIRKKGIVTEFPKIRKGKKWRGGEYDDYYPVEDFKAEASEKEQQLEVDHVPEIVEFDENNPIEGQQYRLF